MIEINNLTAEKIDESFLKKACEKILNEELSKNKELSVAFIGSAEMKKLNKKYRKINSATDVLSFENSSGFGISDFLGEIVICPSSVKKNAKEDRNSFKSEIIKVLIHGVLHLLGYDHEKSYKEAKKMEQKQNYYIKLFQVE